MMKKNKIATAVLTGLVTALILASGLMKAIHLPWSVDGLNKVGLSGTATIVGLIEMSFAVLFAIPKTMRLGAILLSCYFAAAMGIELTHGGPMLNPGIPLALVWIAAFVRDRALFLGDLAQRNFPAKLPA